MFGLYIYLLFVYTANDACVLCVSVHQGKQAHENRITKERFGDDIQS